MLSKNHFFIQAKNICHVDFHKNLSPFSQGFQKMASDHFSIKRNPILWRRKLTSIERFSFYVIEYREQKIKYRAQSIEYRAQRIEVKQRGKALYLISILYIPLVIIEYIDRVKKQTSIFHLYTLCSILYTICSILYPLCSILYNIERKTLFGSKLLKPS